MSISLQLIDKTTGQIFTEDDVAKIDNNFSAIETNLNNIAPSLQQQSKTYTELALLVANNQLIAGTQYLLTDYATKYQQPDTLTIKTMSVERLILTATSTNTFNIVCSSLDYSQDIIHYRFDLNLCEDGTTPRNGFIVRRIDETPSVQINYSNDWRKILWARWKPDVDNYLIGTTSTPYSIWTSGNAVLGTIYKSGNSLYIAKNNNIPISATDSDVFSVVYNDVNIGELINNNLNMGNYGGSAIYLIKGVLHERVTFGVSCGQIYLMEQGNSVLNNNVFGNSCNIIIFGSGCNNNTFGDYCNNNTFSGRCIKNKLGINCSGNTFGNFSSSNILGNGCNNNRFETGFNANILGNNCLNNNTLNAGCDNNTFGDNKNRLFIKYMSNKNISSVVSLENRFYTTTIEKRSNSSTVYYSLDSTNTNIYTVIP